MSPARFDPAALRAARLRAGLTQAAVADAVGVASDGAVWRWEHGQDEPAPRFLPKLAELLDVSVLELFEAVAEVVPLRLMRKIAGLTLMEVAGRTGIAYSRYRGIEQGTVRVRTVEVARIAAAFGVAEGDVWRAAGEAPPTYPPSQ